MWSNSYKRIISGTIALILIIAAAATGLKFLGQDKAYAALGQQPGTTGNVQSGASLNGTTDSASSQTDKPESGNTGSDSLAAGRSQGTSATSSGKTSNTSAVGSSAKKLSLEDIIESRGLTASQLQIHLFVDISDKLLTVYNGSTPLKSYHVELGDSGSGDKKIAGDHKTPEGDFYITQKLVLSPSDEYLGSRWMRLSYPNIEDAERGLDSGLIDKATYDSIVNAINNGQTPPQNTALGGGVGIHGGSTLKLGTNWTYGCVGLSNADVEDFYNFVKVGTRVTIEE